MGTMLDFNGGGLQFDGVFDPSVRAITIQAGGAIFDTQTNHIIFENAIGDGGDGGLTKKGSGVLTLSAAPNYKGATTVNGGILEIAGGIDAAQMSVIDVLSGTACLKSVNVNKSSLNITTSAAATFEVEDGMHLVGTITGDGITLVDGGASLTVKTINQRTLTIGSGGKITIQPLGSGPLSGSCLVVPEPSTLILLISSFMLFAFAWAKRLHW
jgi:autotransporter-associated beta strand protein